MTKNKQDTLEFQAFSWNVDDGVSEKTDYENMDFTVHIFGKTKKGESVGVHVKKYQPYFCVEFHESISTFDEYESLCNLLHTYLTKWEKDDETDKLMKIADYPDHLVVLDEPIVKATTLWGYTFGKKIPFFKFAFKSMQAHNKILSIFKATYKNKLSLDEMESFYNDWCDIKLNSPKDYYQEQNNFLEEYSQDYTVSSSLLRWICKLGKVGLSFQFAKGRPFEVMDPILRFAHLRNLRMAGWIKITNPKAILNPLQKETTCLLEFNADYENLFPVQSDDICPLFREMSFDIEAYSYNDLFPDPSEKRNYAYQIGITLKNYSDKVSERILLHCRTPEELRGKNSGYCDEIPVTEVCVRGKSENMPELCKHKVCAKDGHLYEYVSTRVENFQDEKSLLLRFSEIIVTEDPDTIYAYNSDIFDWNYLMVRAKVTGCLKEFSQISRKKKYECKTEEKKFNSSAYGDNKYMRVDIPGRLNVDLMIWVQRNMPADRYPSYSLDTVAEIEISQKKRDIDVKEIFEAFRSGDSKQCTKIGDYCCQDTILVQKLVIKLDVVTQMFEMANITDVPPMYLLQKGQQIKAYSQISKKAMEKGFFVPFCDYKEEGSFTGAIVLDPKIGMYKTPIAVLDFASLYPSIQVAYKVCYTTLVLDKTLEKRILQIQKEKNINDKIMINDTEFSIIEWDDNVIVYTKRNQDWHIVKNYKPHVEPDPWEKNKEYFINDHVSHQDKIYCCVKSHTSQYSPRGQLKTFTNIDDAKTGMKRMKKDINDNIVRNDDSEFETFRHSTIHHRYCFAQNTLSVIPDLQIELKKSRKAVKNKMAEIEHSENPEDQLRYRVLNGRQLAIKVSMNSIYGFTSAFMLNLLALSASVTAKGRQMIEQTLNFMEKDFEKIAFKEKWSKEDVYTFYTESGRQVVLYPENGKPEKEWIKKYPAAKLNETWTTKPLKINVVGGDSVTGDTPLLLQDKNGNVMYKTIDSIAETEWRNEIDDKEYSTSNLKVWSDSGFTPILHIMRHKTDKKMFRISTHTGVVDVTQDHSLLRQNGDKVSPKDVFIGEKLLHCDLPNRIFGKQVLFDTEYAWALGLFYADGSCGSYDCKSGKKNSWALNNQNKDLLNKAKSALENYEKELTFKILETMKSSSIYKLVPNSGKIYGSIAKLVVKFRNWFYDESRLKKVPDFILNANHDIRFAFAQGYYSGDGYYKDKKNKGLEFSNKGKIGSAGLYHLFSSLGYTLTVDTRNDKPNIFRTRCYSRHKSISHNLEKVENNSNWKLIHDERFEHNLLNLSQPLNEIKKIVELPQCSQYVYDIETENHHFGIGPGRMIVHNTDSVFCNFAESTLDETISLCHKAEVILTDEIFNRKPIEMEYEKTYVPMVIQKKKNYIGLKYEMDSSRWKIDYKGIAVKRRNYCPFVKQVFWNVIYPSLGVESCGKKKVSWDFRQGPDRAIESLKESLEKLTQNKVDYEDLVMSASLKSNYKGKLCEDCNGKSKNCKLCGGTGKITNLPHVQLAKRMKERDEGSAPISGQRFGFVIVNETSRKDELWAKSEDPKYARQNNLAPDYLFYLNQQVRKPLTKFLTLVGKEKETENVFEMYQNILYENLKNNRRNLEAENRKNYFNRKEVVPVAPLKIPKKQPVSKNDKKRNTTKESESLSLFFGKKAKQ